MRDKIIQRDLAEFYILSALSPIIEQKIIPIHSKLLIYRNNLVVDIVQFYLEHLQHACVQEASYENCRQWPNRRTQTYNREQLELVGIKDNTDISCDYLYARKDENAASNTFESAKRLIAVFRHMNWSTSYGGEAWARIADLYLKLLECRASFSVLDLSDYDPNRGYDIYTHSVIREIRNHLDGRGDNRIQKTMHVIDMIHQIEHNTGSIFTKFPGSMTEWLDNMLNEKAIACSIQILRDSVGVEIKNIMQELGVEDRPASIAEQQLGQVIVERRRYKDSKKYEEQFKQQIQTIEEDLTNNYITEDVYEEQKKAIESEKQTSSEEPSLSTYITALNEHYDSSREQRGILREIVCVSEHKDDFLKEENDILQYVKNSLGSDFEMFKILKDAPKWHASLAKYIIPQYSNIPFKWKKVASDFLYENFDNLLLQVDTSSHLNLSLIRTLYECLYGDGYDMSRTKLSMNDKFICNCSACRPDALNPRPDHSLDNKAKTFVGIHNGKQIIGTPDWISKSVNVGSKSSHVDEDMPIGTVIGWKKFGKICFVPSEHWRESGYTAESYEVVLTNIDLYNQAKPKKLKKPKNARSFARVYAGQKIKFIKDAAANWNQSLPAGIVIGYSSSMENSVYYIPTDEFKSAGYNGMKSNDVVYTVDGYDGVPCYHSAFNEINVYTDPYTKAVDVYDVPMKPVPPKGGGSAKEFATKYSGKAIKATNKYAYSLNAINNWDNNNPIGTIVGYIDSSKYGKTSSKLCFVPSEEFKNAGWGGLINFNSFICTEESLKDAKTYYTISWNNIELSDPSDYEKQTESIELASKLSYNQKFAVKYAGKEFLGVNGGWKSLGTSVKLKKSIGTIIGYKGSLICYTPSQQMIDAGFDGQKIDNITYTVQDAKDKKCYTLLGTSTIRVNEKSDYYGDDLHHFATKYSGQEIKGVGKEWKTLVNGSIRWDMNWPIGTVVGYNHPSAICYIPSQQLKDFGYVGTELNYSNIVYTTTDKKNIPYYEVYSLTDIAPVKIIEDKMPSMPMYKKAPSGADNKAVAKMFAGKKVKKIKNTASEWNKDDVVGTIVGYKGNKCIVWKPTLEYNKLHRPQLESPDSSKIVFIGGVREDIKELRWCFLSSLEICDDELTAEQKIAQYAIKNAGEDIIDHWNKGKCLGYVVGYTKDKICYVPKYHLTDENAIKFEPTLAWMVSGQTLVETIRFSELEPKESKKHFPINNYTGLDMEPVDIPPAEDYINLSFSELDTDRDI